MPLALAFGLPFRLALAALVATALCWAQPARAEKRVALVIGNDRYLNMPADRQLQKAVNDANTVAAAMKTLGFEVLVGTNLGRQGMIDKLAEFTARLEPGDTAAFFFAGHGVAIHGVNYLVPSDVPAVSEGAEARVRGASLAEPDIIAELQAKSVRVALLVIDACRDNPFPRAAGRSIGNTRGLADAKPARGVFTLYSAGIGQTALDRLSDRDAANNSVFTRIFAEQLVRPDLHLGDLAVEVRERVATLALKATDGSGQPAPHEQTPAYYDQTLGGRIFLGRALSGGSFATAGTPQPQTKTAALSPPKLEAAVRPQRPGSADERCARNDFETYCVSSVLPSQFGNSYGPENLFMQADGVAWVEGKPGQGVGEWITVEFDTLRTINSVMLRSGYQKNADIFAKNGRVKQLRMMFSTGETMILNPPDRAGSEMYRLEKPVRAYWIKFTVEGVFPGRRYSDLAISKLLVNSEPAQ
jgi:Caspase domain